MGKQYLKLIQLFTFTIVVLLFGVPASAHDFEVDGIYYNITSSANLTVSVTYRGNNYNDYSNEYTGTVSIPETVTYNNKTYDVTSIGISAFRDCPELLRLSIPATVIEVGNEVFNNCKALKSIRFEDGDNILSLGVHGGRYDTWAATKNIFYDCPLETVYIGRNLDYPTNLDGSYTPFYDKGELSSVTIGSTVTFLSDNMFYKCSNVKNLRIEDSNISLTVGGSIYDKSLFQDLHQLDSLYLGRNIDGKNTFSKVNLKIVKLGEMVTEINPQMFEECRALVEINLHEKITKIGESAFALCVKLPSVTIPRSVKCIENKAFYNCISITSLYIPNTIDSIGNAAVPTGLNEVYIEDGTTELHLGYYNYNSTSMGMGLFHQDVTKLHLGRDIVYNTGHAYGRSPFYACELKEVSLGNNVTRLGDNLFQSSKLKEIIIPENIITIGKCCFDFCEELTSVTFSNSVQIIDSAAFYHTGLKNLVIPEGVDSIGDYAFAYCYNLTHIVIPSTLKKAGIFIFGDCRALKDVQINCPIVGYWFSGTYSLRNITFSDSVKTIRGYFSDSDNLNTIIIGKNVSNICDRAFFVDAIDTVYVKAQEAVEFNTAIFSYSLYDTAVLCIPYGAEESYSSTMPWRLFKNRTAIPTGISEVLNDNKNNKHATYNIRGARMQNTDNLPKGIYIKNGKKYLIK